MSHEPDPHTLQHLVLSGYITKRVECEGLARETKLDFRPCLLSEVATSYTDMSPSSGEQGCIVYS